MPGPMASGRDTLLATPGHDVPDSGEESFDPAGVQELRRVMTERSTHDGRDSETFQLAHNTRSASFASSAINLSGLNPVDGFDLDKILRHVVRR